MLLPDDQRIPSATNLDEANELLGFLGSWMKIDTGNICLQLHSDIVSPEAIGQFDSANQSVVKIHESQFADRSSLIAVLAWQIGNYALNSDAVRDVKLADIGWTTDLLPTFFGLGIFSANNTLRSPQKEANHFAWWGMRQRAYLPGRVFGYAMALRQHVQSADASWSNLLSLDAQVALNDGLKYLTKTQDTTLTHESIQQRRGDRSIDGLQEELRAGSPSAKISAMWELAERAQRSENLGGEATGELLADCIRHKELEVRAVAATTLPLADRSSNAAMELADALRDGGEEVRIAAAGAIGAFAGVDDETLVSDLTDALKDSERLVVFNAARSLTFFGEAAESSQAMLMKRLRQALVECRDSDAETLIWALDSIVPDAPGALTEFFGEADEEFRIAALEILEQLHQAA
ncbi:MAG: HEAT repeat domain-containing protein [Rubripirellula sp.]